MIFDQFFAYLSAISLLESTEKKKKRDICMLFRKRGANIVVKTPGGGGDSHNVQDMNWCKVSNYFKS